MTVINKYPFQTKKRNKEFFKRKEQELTNLDWAKWAGWFDTDGCFTTQWNKKIKAYQLFVNLRLRDRQPVELFSHMFETSLCYQEGTTITPDGKHYISKQFRAALSGPKAVWFTENLSPYLIKEAKREYAGTLLKDTVQSKDFNNWTKDEVTQYLATVIEGDGTIQLSCSETSKSIAIAVSSNNTPYLANLVSIAASKLNLKSKFKKTKDYETRRGTMTMYDLYINCSKKNPGNIDFFRSLLKYNVMTLDRKKEKIQEFITWYDDDRAEKLRLENRV
tara:strand:+ start:84 stop:914 length:831 start_codon:yes stop_codon:yes gene_type:complete